MKKTTYYLIASVIFLFACNKSKEYTNAAEYNNAIIDLQENVYVALDSLDDIINKHQANIEQIDSAYNYAKRVTDESLKKLKKIGDFEDDNSLNSSAKELFTAISNLLDNEYPKIIEQAGDSLENWSDSDFDDYYDTWDRIEEKISEKESKFFKAQDNFFKNYQIDKNEIEE